MTEELEVMHHEDGITSLKLNRPKAYNALSLSLMLGMQDALDNLPQTTRVVIIQGAGAGFCAGHDLKELRSHSTEEAFYKKVFQKCSELMMTLHQLPQPVIAAVHGIATAAGCQLVATCDLAVADEGAAFATPGVNIGLFCSTPMVALTRNVSNKHAMQMLLTGDRLPAEQAKQIGLINVIAESGQHYETARALAHQIIAKSPLTLAIGKKAFYEQRELPLHEAYQHCSEVMTKNMLTLDAQEGIAAQLEKRPAIWQGR